MSFGNAAGPAPGDSLAFGLSPESDPRNPLYTQPGGQGFTPPVSWQRTQGSSSPMSMDVVDQYVDPATGQRYNMVGQPIGGTNTFGAPFLPQGQERVAENAPTPDQQFPNLMQNPAFNPQAQPQPQPVSQPPAPPAQQLQQIAQGVPSLVNQLAPPPAQGPVPGSSITQQPPAAKFPNLMQNPAFNPTQAQRMAPAMQPQARPVLPRQAFVAPRPVARPAPRTPVRSPRPVRSR